ncbi:asparagine synthase (glutamine-hydrolyzing) [Embleya scabrispora]|uniref:asparagine synthase (glutamine-hydrolyzing) n=1 Tax=Embleya scabrispora TaxID=159449 RepID=UPI0003629F12|nr:asparagine synthase (glutamine-hydrolyzing) [Embleya scabrispora]MYS85000.1 asparagine synthase (glutamine-hydrolyzing) [Streptomyces sp. SID5474]
MCGITGWVSFEHDARPRRAVLDAMTATLARRGPDAGDGWVDGHAALGHRRLAVLDVEGGGQPMLDRDDEPQVVLSYSGEVYNHHELRAELRRAGHRFRTRSDTETVLRTYLEWGEGCVDRFEGMYAFAIWDVRRACLLLVRDRLGVKPLHWAFVEGGIAFASEPKALFAHPEIDPIVDADGLRAAYGLLFDTGPTVWAGIREVEPGSVLRFGRDGIRETAYWQLAIRPHEDDRATTVERVGELVGRACRSQLEADVPVCSLLSGGLDSTVVTALLADELRLREGPEARIRSYAVDYTDQAESFTADVLRTGHDTPHADRDPGPGIDRNLDRTGPTDLADTLAGDLSGGQRQRAWIAMVLARQTPIVLPGEPTTFLDIAHQYDLLELCAELNAEGRTVVAVLHDLDQAARFAANLVVMKAGRVVAEGPPAPRPWPEARPGRPSILNVQSIGCACPCRRATLRLHLVAMATEGCSHERRPDRTHGKRWEPRRRHR